MKYPNKTDKLGTVFHSDKAIRRDRVKWCDWMIANMSNKAVL